MLPLTIFFPISSTNKIPFCPGPHTDWLQTSKLIQTPFQSKSDHKEAFPVFPLLGHYTTNYLSMHEIFSWMFTACNQIQPTQHIVLWFLFSFICSSWCRWMNENDLIVVLCCVLRDTALHKAANLNLFSSVIILIKLLHHTHLLHHKKWEFIKNYFVDLSHNI